MCVYVCVVCVCARAGIRRARAARQLTRLKSRCCCAKSMNETWRIVHTAAVGTRMEEHTDTPTAMVTATVTVTVMMILKLGEEAVRRWRRWLVG